MRIATLFSGIGAPEQAAKRVFIDEFRYSFMEELEKHDRELYGEPKLQIVFACEWDKYARQSYLANYEIDEAYFHTDVKELDGTQYQGKVDVLIGGSPCQAFSIEGMRGGTDDERGQLIYQYVRVVEEVQAPVIVYENVKGMLSINGGRTMKEFVKALREIGYYCHYEVLNTKDYGVPQNRERIFLVGFLDHEAYYRFSFAPKIPLTKRLKDVLEPIVDEKYYLNRQLLDYKSQANRIHPIDKEVPTINAGTHGYSQGYIKVIGKLDIKGDDYIKRVYDDEGISPCLPTMQGGMQEPKIQVKSAVKQGFEVATVGDSINLSMPNSETRRGRVGKQIAQTLDCACNQAVVEPKIIQKSHDYRKDGTLREYTEDCPTLAAKMDDTMPMLEQDYRIRKLTPRECLRLQDFPDTFKQVVSDSQMYKQAGNSMTVAVVEMIFRQIDKALTKQVNNTSLFGAAA